jgi:hypothetical protein
VERWAAWKALRWARLRRADSRTAQSWARARTFECPQRYLRRRRRARATFPTAFAEPAPVQATSLRSLLARIGARGQGPSGPWTGLGAARHGAGRTASVAPPGWRFRALCRASTIGCQPHGLLSAVRDHEHPAGAVPGDVLHRTDLNHMDRVRRKELRGGVLLTIELGCAGGGSARFPSPRRRGTSAA